MILNLPLLVALSGVGVTWASASNCLSGASFDTCCADRKSVGKGTVDGVVMNYACGTYAKDETLGYGAVTKGVATPKDCAGLCARDTLCQGGFWSSSGSKCYLLNTSGFKVLPSGGAFFQFKKTAEDPVDVDECKDRVESATSQCNAEKDKIKQDGAQALQKCQGDKDAALSQARSKCEEEKQAIRNENAQAADQASKQCEADKDQLRQQLAAAVSQYEKDKADLQQQLAQCQANVPAPPPVPAIDPICETNSWVNMCSSCPQDTFNIDGKEFKKKCGVRTVGAREEQWLWRSSLIQCLKECGARGDCLGVGWRAAEGVNGHCHAHISTGRGLRNVPNWNEHLIYVTDRVNFF
ncbi:hypothetical protein BDV26DRAFT_290375 [Aspergillus bertholletiae]|uniref:Apple domain-containing protein n=1 Tax=Aspergillus bertholletiae TaxID=1226010 RepID=A0A5N7BFB8_9EURO|nr:hypothetical protein BDV26DRAFT_290375 [Aspergillus bertholletiae]